MDAKNSWMKLLPMLWALTGTLPGQVTLIPDAPTVRVAASGVTVTPGSDGKAAISGLGISGTVQLVLPSLPAGTTETGSVRFPSAVNVRIRQSWSGGSTSLTIEGTAIGRCSTNLDERDCPINFLDVESTDARRAYLDADVQLVAPGSSSFPRVTIRFRWRIGGPPSSPVELEPVMEVVQTVQTEQGDVPMVSGKKTVVRVFARQTGDGPVVSGIRARLNAWKLGDGNARTELQPKDAEVVAGTIAATKGAVNRNDPASSLLFKVPSAWIESPGFVELRVELLPPAGISLSRPEKLIATKAVGFRPSPSHRVLWFRLPYVSGGKARFPSGDFSRMEDQLKAIYPIGERDLEFVPIPMKSLTDDPKGLVLSKRLESARAALGLLAWISQRMKGSKIAPHDQSVAFLSDDAILDTRGAVGLADPKWDGGEGKAIWVLSSEAKPEETFARVAHEVGHNLGLHHTDLTPAGCTHAPDGRRTWFGYGYRDGTVQEPGYDTLLGRFISKSLFDLMNYCPAPTLWISPKHYTIVLDEMLARNAVPRSSPQGASRQAVVAEYWAVSGSMEQGGLSGQLDPALRFTTSEPGSEPDPAGPLCLRFEGASGLLSEFCFSPPAVHVETGAALEHSYFSLQVPYVPGATRLALVYRGQGGERELHALEGGNGAPALSIVTPQANDRLQGTVNLTWNGSDPGGLPLSYLVDFSNDGGETWYPMTLLPFSDPEFPIDTTEVVGGDNVHFRVTALNGLHTTSATVGPVRIAQEPRLTTAATLDFGEVSRGGTYTRDLEITNAGIGPYTIRSLSIDNNAFRISSTLPNYVWTGDGPRALPVRFEPASTGAVEATLTINGEIRVRLTGRVTDGGTGTGGSGSGSGGGGTGGGTQGGTDLVKITPLIARGWPNERNFDNLPRNAVDGNTNTFTWTTNPNNTVLPSYFGVDFGASKPVSRIRIYKDNDGGGGALSDHFKNLVIEYTTGDASIALANRTWVRVTGLANGFNGAELLTAVAVNSDGTVTRDSHNSATNGWASLTFTAVNATGIRIGFSNVSNPAFFNHYKVHEFEAFGPATPVVAAVVKVTPLTARGWPNERTFDNLPPNAVDGNTNTFTWTTNPNTITAPSYFGVDLGSAKSVSRIRMYKDNDGGGGTASDHFKNLVIEYTTTSASTALANRTWTRVSGLVNGFNGGELLTAAAVNADGTVTRDSHNSATSGWASLTFSAVNATGIRIGFSNVTNPVFYNHYKVHEFEVYGPSNTAGTTSRVLQVDDGSVELSSGFDEGGVQGYFVNRLTPAAYPATLRKVLVQFPASGAPLAGLPIGSAIQILSGTTTGSGAQLTGVALTRTNATVSAFQTFLEFDVPPVTLQSGGSFLVGFSVLNPPGVYPAAVDTSASAQRSYVGTDGTTFFLYDSLTGIRPGNLLIRARVD